MQACRAVDDEPRRRDILQFLLAQFAGEAADRRKQRRPPGQPVARGALRIGIAERDPLALATTLTACGDKAKEAADAAKASADQAAATAKDAAAKAADASKAAATNAADATKDAAMKASDATRDAAMKAGDATKDAAARAVDAAKEAAKPADAPKK